ASPDASDNVREPAGSSPPPEREKVTPASSRPPPSKTEGAKRRSSRPPPSTGEGERKKERKSGKDVAGGVNRAGHESDHHAPRKKKSKRPHPNVDAKPENKGRLWIVVAAAVALLVGLAIMSSR